MHKIKKFAINLLALGVIAWGLISLLSAAGCRTKMVVNKSDSLVIRDSVREVVKVREVLKVIQKDSVVLKDSLRIREIFNCNENQVYRVNRSGDEFRIQIKDGKVFLDVDLKGTQNRFREIISSKQREADSLYDVNLSLRHATARTEIVQEKKPWYYPILIWIVSALALYGLINLGTLLIRKLLL